MIKKVETRLSSTSGYSLAVDALITDREELNRFLAVLDQQVSIFSMQLDFSAEIKAAKQYILADFMRLGAPYIMVSKRNACSTEIINKGYRWALEDLHREKLLSVIATTDHLLYIQYQPQTTA